MEISTEEVRASLRERLGDALAAAVAEDAASALRTYEPLRTDLDALAKLVEKHLFRALYRELGVRMVYIRDDGQRARLGTEELPALADCAMGALFHRLHATPANYALLHDYAMRTGSLAALYTLCHRYAHLQPKEETAVMERILLDRHREIHPV